ncbi:hypothetical protein ColTof4_00079 [Colletotrichum tofieldiae]|nr:hypothetical protein ColTof3_07277 [Colletotrichum tofieldiae]GKT67656.1 hypothetical protein ColTof4_00079 [Colletotrichum tofieldiae]
MTAKCPKRSATTSGQSTSPSLVLLASPAGLFPLLRKDPETFQKLEAHVEQTPGEECRPLHVVPGHATDRVLDPKPRRHRRQQAPFLTRPGQLARSTDRTKRHLFDEMEGEPDVDQPLRAPDIPCFKWPGRRFG